MAADAAFKSDILLGRRDDAFARLIEETDWTASPLGSPDEWPVELSTLFTTCLECRFPFCLWWGPDLGFLYNEAYAPILGAKHPGAFGRAGREIWSEIWDVIGPMLGGVMQKGEATHARDLLLVMQRSGYIEEAYFEFSYSPIRDRSGAVVGIFTPVVETTERVVGERRLRTLRDLAERAQGAVSADEACRSAAEVLAENPKDVPFALIYRIDPGASHARLAGAAGLSPGDAGAPALVALDDTQAVWPLAAAAGTGQPARVDDLPARFSGTPPGPWENPPIEAAVLPVGVLGQDRPAAILVLGVNPRRQLDDEHRGFHTLVAGQVATALSRALAYEEERRRAEALAELDCVKTAFFSNISHEFRTPLTLMLSPLEELLGERGELLTPEGRELLGVAHRNGLRLLRLVNTLLDFSRVEAGRAQASYEPVDLAARTAELAGNFRSACERAGLDLVVDCPTLPCPVFVDRDMWEKIVLNLLSNAFKFTPEGRIAVSVRAAGGAAEVRISDTGIGIPAAELPRLFERFHRIEGARGRSVEGSGIGLALVQELVRLHGGTVDVESEPGKGSTFAVRIPFGASHLPAERIGTVRPEESTAIRAEAFVQEALSWVADRGPDGGPRHGGGPHRPRVLLADDNADMRDHIRRLLAGSYEVEAVADGEAALAAAMRTPPDLVLTDIMMPRLDGFDLLRALRESPATRDLPIILLSARAGEEARIEGLEAGADDYLVKPFFGRELLARVRANLDLARVRNAGKAEIAAWRERYQAAVRASGDLLFDWDVDSGQILFGAELERITGYTADELAGGLEAWLEIVHPDDRAVANGEVARVGATGDSVNVEYRIVRKDGRIVDLEANGHFVRDANGRKRRVVGFARDVTLRKRADAHRQMLLDELNHRVKNTLALVQSIAQQTLRGDGSAEELGARFVARLLGLSRSNDLLSGSRWEGAGLRDVVAAEMTPFTGDPAAPRVAVHGDPVHLEPKAALALGMALHELATNAAKYGALSVPEGRVEIVWNTSASADGSTRLRLLWAELGGPPVQPPTRRGFGSRLLERGLALELGGTARVDFAADGVRCEIECLLPPKLVVP